jgi:stage V sporulation protein K
MNSNDAQALMGFIFTMAIFGLFIKAGIARHKENVKNSSNGIPKGMNTNIFYPWFEEAEVVDQNTTQGQLLYNYVVKPNDHYVAQLNEMIGLQDVKLQLTKIISSHVVNSVRQKSLGSKEEEKPLHMAFLGNPGTGKTEVARCLAGILHEAGILPTNKFVEKKASDLIGEYIGQTAPKVTAACREAEGGLLFIDEAYVWQTTPKFGPEAAAQLLQHMENERGKFIVVMAGYPDDMKKLHAMNPGFKSRIPYHVDFPDYNDAELAQILEKMASDKKMKFEPDAMQLASRYLSDVRSVAGEYFANAREARNLFQNIVDLHSIRVLGSSTDLKSVLELSKTFSHFGQNRISSHDLTIIKKEDVMPLFAIKPSQTNFLARRDF